MSGQPIPEVPAESADTLPALRTLAAAMSVVREDCVWSAGMTHESLMRYLLEEAHELLEAVQTGTAADIREELGDVLLQVVFHSEVAATTGEGFALDDVARSALEKMIRRHPHVFGDQGAASVAEVERVWGEAKAREKAHRTTLLAGIAPTLPGLARAQKVAGRVSGAGWDDLAGPDAALPDTEAELGAQLFALAAAAQRRGWDAESALQAHLGRIGAAITRREAVPE